ncbi:MAG TPA: sigma-70 family RNA polymerase sigma factor [Candidatus Deferrimicrobium sp.]|nr:sigma-70 family RNA polymerase sigma factor [Candidatus Deferrimicrobium sp.]
MTSAVTPDLQRQEMPVSAHHGKVSEEVQTRVRLALSRLTVEEREFIVHYYFTGKSYRQISELTGRTAHKLEALHTRAVKKLQKELSRYVSERFGVIAATATRCRICASPVVAEIDGLIRRRNKTATWKPIIKLLREKYGLRIRSPQALIAHEKYHCCSDIDVTNNGVDGGSTAVDSTACESASK